MFGQCDTQCGEVCIQGLLWLLHWQADMRSKWRLASSPYKCANLFGEALKPILIENKDKRKIMPYMHRRADHRPSSYYQRQPFRSAESGSNVSQFQQPSSQGHKWFPGRSTYRDRDVKLRSSGPFEDPAVDLFIAENDTDSPIGS